MDRIIWTAFATIIIMLVTILGTGVRNKYKIKLHPLVIGMASLCAPMVPILFIGYYVEFINGVYLISYGIIIIMLLIKYVKHMEIPCFKFLIIPIIFQLFVYDMSYTTPDDLFYGNIVEAGSEFWDKFGYSKSHGGIYQKNIYTYVTVPWLYFRSFISALLGLNPQSVNGAINRLLRYVLITIGVKSFTKWWVTVSVIFISLNAVNWSSIYVRDLDVLFALSLIFITLSDKKPKIITAITMAMMSSASIVVLPVTSLIDIIKTKKFNPYIILPTLIWVPQDVVLFPLILVAWLFLFIFSKMNEKVANIHSFIPLTFAMTILLREGTYYSFVAFAPLILVLSTIVLVIERKNKVISILLSTIIFARTLINLDFDSKFWIMAWRMSAISIFLLFWVTTISLMNIIERKFKINN